MERLIKKYEEKLIAQGLCDEGEAILGALDAETIWNKHDKKIDILNDIINTININSILFARPKEPFFSILNCLSHNNDTIYPEDTETRTFLHDIPIAGEFSSSHIAAQLKRRKSVIIKDHGIVTFGIVSPEQAFVTFSSVCFSLFVKFFTDIYFLMKEGKPLSLEQKRTLKLAADTYGDFISRIDSGPSIKGPFTSPDEVTAAMAEAGRLTVESRMVDSFFGNISYRLKDTIYISQTGSSLDELEGYIDPCPLDGSRTNAVTASSEFSAHKKIFETQDVSAILHGHPKFSVIISMLCDEMDCDNRGLCYKKCSHDRLIEDIPIIPGEVGTGPTGISTTLPPALSGRGAIVYGHGLFTTGRDDFKGAFKNLMDIEKMCFRDYEKRVLEKI